MDKPEIKLLKTLRETAEENLRFYSNSGREERERWIVSEFLIRQKMQFSKEELFSPHQHSKIDVAFRDARFQVKEILNPETKRHRDVRATYDHLMAIHRLQDIVWPMFCYDVPPVTTVYSLVTDKAFRLSIYPKYMNEKAKLDLIFYVTHTRAALIQKEEIDHKYLSSLGWRSISCLVGKQATVLSVSKNAPSFLRSLHIVS